MAETQLEDVRLDVIVPLHLEHGLNPGLKRRAYQCFDLAGLVAGACDRCNRVKGYAELGGYRTLSACYAGNLDIVSVAPQAALPEHVPTPWWHPRFAEHAVQVTRDPVKRRLALESAAMAVPMCALRVRNACDCNWRIKWAVLEPVLPGVDFYCDFCVPSGAPRLFGMVAQETYYIHSNRESRIRRRGSNHGEPNG